VTTGRTN